MRTLSRNALAFILAFSFILSSVFQTSYACGPFSRYAIFSYTKHPDMPLERFPGGDLGVLQRTYARSYLFVAYREMNGWTFGKAEKEALSSLWKERLEFPR